MTSALREIFAAFDIDTGSATTKLKSLDGVLDTTKNVIGTLAASFAGVLSLHAFKDFLSEQIEIGSKLRDTSEKLGIGTDELQRFQFAAGQVGVESDNASNGLNFLNKNVGLVAEGNQVAIDAFKRLGVSVKDGQGNFREVGDLLPEIAEGFKGLGSQQERTSTSMEIFGRAGASLLPLLKGGAASVNEMNAEFERLGGGMNEDFITAAKKAGDEIYSLKFALQGLKSRLAVEVLPSVTAFVQKLQGAVIYFRHLTKETNIVKDTLAVLGVVSSIAAAKMVLGWAKVFGLFPKGNLGLAKTLASMGYLGVIIALVAGLALVFEDLWTGISGGDSAIRDWLNAANGVEATDELFKNLETTTKQVKLSFESMKPALGSIVQAVGDILLSPYFIASLEFAVRLIGSLLSLLIGAARAAGNIVTGDLEGAGKAVDQAGDAVFSKKGFFGADAWKPSGVDPNAAPDAQPFVGPSYLDPSSKDYQGNVGDTTVTVGQITVVGGPANEDTGKAVASAVRGTFEDDKKNALAALRRGPAK